MQADGLQSPYGQWLANLADRPRRSEPITTRITVGEYFPARDQALRAHATQVDPDGWFFLVPRQLEQAVWPWEEFELVRSDVSVNLPEDDLFAGLR
jgi:mycothiol S-conjugate amidase